MAQRHRRRNFINVLPTRAGRSCKRFFQISFVKLKNLDSFAGLSSISNFDSIRHLHYERSTDCCAAWHVLSPSLRASSDCANFAHPKPVAKPSPSAPPADYDLRWGVKIPMRDKVELNATLYLPKSGNARPGRTPVIFTLTLTFPTVTMRAPPISPRMATPLPWSMCADAENSAGDFEPFANDARDGHDLVDGLRNSRFVTATSRCGAVPTPDLINGPRPRNCLLTSHDCTGGGGPSGIRFSIHQ